MEQHDLVVGYQDDVGDLPGLLGAVDGYSPTVGARVCRTRGFVGAVQDTPFSEELSDRVRGARGGRPAGCPLGPGPARQRSARQCRKPRGEWRTRR